MAMTTKGSSNNSDDNGDDGRSHDIDTTTNINNNIATLGDDGDDGKNVNDSFPSISPLWSDDDVEIRDDGYLFLRKDTEAYKLMIRHMPKKKKKKKKMRNGYEHKRSDEEVCPEEEPPPLLLLHSTEVLLKALHPKTNRLAAILQQPGYVNLHDVDKTEKTENKNESKNDDVNLETETETETETQTEDQLAQAVEEKLKLVEPSENHHHESQTVSDVELCNEEQNQSTTNRGNGNVEVGDEEPASVPSSNKGGGNNDGSKLSIPTDFYLPYQSLMKGDNIPNRIEIALLDIACFRHKSKDESEGAGGNGDASKEKHKKKKERRSQSNRELKKVEALEMQQRRLLKMKSSSTSTTTATTTSSTSDQDADVKLDGDRDEDDDGDIEQRQEIVADDAHDDDGEDEGEKVVDDEEEEDIFDLQRSEPYMLIRLVRTLNSIRAIFPFLMGMFNHPLRNDKELKIRETSCQSKKKRSASCWLISTQVYATITNKNCLARNKDLVRILERIVGTQYATLLRKDWMCLHLSDLWSSRWIREVLKRARPTIEHPHQILLQQNNDGDAKDADDRVGKILTQARLLDEVIECRQQVDLDCGPDTQRHYDRTVSQLKDRLEKHLKSRFPRAHINLYGSCLSNLSLGKGSDVDLSLWIPEADRIKTEFRNGTIAANKYEREMKRLVYNVYHRLEMLHKEFTNMQPVARARIPVIKGTWLKAGNPYKDDGSIDFDICFLNDIAVANSSLLGEYTKVDPRVRTFLIAIKQFAKERKINSAKDGTISSYAWVNLAIFYLQCIGFVPNLQSTVLMDEVGFVKNPQEYWHFLNSLDTTFVKWDEVKNIWTMPAEYETTPVSLLVYGFLEFYSRRFPSWTFAISMKHGRICIPKLSARKVTSFLSIEDPFETYDSHTPHDLGTPADEQGSVAIMEFIQEAEYHIEDILCNGSDIVGNNIDIWPPSPYKEFSKPPQAAKKSIQANKDTNSQHRSPPQKTAPNKSNPPNDNPAGTTEKKSASKPVHKRRRGKKKDDGGTQPKVVHSQQENQKVDHASQTPVDGKDERKPHQAMSLPDKQTQNSAKSPGKGGKGGRGRGAGRGGRGPGGRGRGGRGGGRGTGKGPHNSESAPNTASDKGSTTPNN